VTSIGDRDPIAYGGAFVYVDETGVYPPEMTVFEPAYEEEWDNDGENSILRIYRIILEPNVKNEWWYEKLADVSQWSGLPVEYYHEMLEGEGSIGIKAMAYNDLIEYFGFENFDFYPEEMTATAAYDRYFKEMKESL
jgi:hypothetical protein